jgi:Zn-dependent protease with chaperone function
MDYIIDNYLEIIQDNNINEIDPITVTLATTTLAAIASLVTIFVAASVLTTSYKVDKKWSKRLNEILGTSDWTVYMIPDPVPQAYAFTGKNVFLTKGLIDYLEPREIEAFMLHEAYHTKSKHIYKSVAYKFPFLFMIFHIATVTVFSTGMPFLALLIYVILKDVPEAALNILVSKGQEKSADSYAVKYGYADDLVSGLRKLEKLYKKRTSRKKCGIVCKAVKKLDYLLSTHPTIQSRIETILKKKEKLKRVLKSRSFKKIKSFITGELKK